MKRSALSIIFSALLSLVFLLSIQIHAFSQDNISKIDVLIQAYIDLGQFNGSVLVAEKGKVIYKKGFGLANREWNLPNEPNTKFRLGSITKQFTSMLILQLVEKGKLDLQGKLSDYLPYYRKDTGSQVTIHHLLTHSSGIPSYTSIPNFFEEISRDPYSVEEFVKKYCSGDFQFEPGSRFLYNNSGYFLLGAIIEEITGKTYEEVLNEKIFSPLGMENSGYDRPGPIIPNRASGYSNAFDGYTNAPYLDMSLPYAAGSLYSTVEDLYLWDQALYTEKLLSAEMRELMFTPHMTNYGYGWGVRQKSLPDSKEKLISIAHGGGINGFNTWIERLVDEKHLIVLLNNTPGANLGQMSDAIIRILYGKPYDFPKKSIANILYKILMEKDVKSAIEQYETLKKDHPKDYNFLAQELNTLGYYLLTEKKRTKDAIEIFKLNIKAYPKYANGYDSLAEAYMISGDKKLAIKNYAKSLELNPNNANAVEKLNELVKNQPYD
ncbi:MAG: serine hydrolase [Candidatus Aminicenantes bacterium]|nr:MAG: serine hydrolase [Candidatus Aminicenantes bacterium]